MKTFTEKIFQHYPGRVFAEPRPSPGRAPAEPRPEHFEFVTSDAWRSKMQQVGSEVGSLEGLCHCLYLISGYPDIILILS